MTGLEQPFVQDRRGEVPAGKRDTYEMAAYYCYRGRLISVIDRNYVKAAQHHRHVAPLTWDQIDVLNLLESIAEEEGFFIDLEWQPETFAFVHDHQILHSRTAYEDHPEPKRMRHNLRL